MWVRCSRSNLCTHVHYLHTQPLAHTLISSSSMFCPSSSSLMPTLWLQFSPVKKKKLLQSRGESIRDNYNSLSIITQNLHCWVGCLHWFLQKNIYCRRNTGVRLSFWGSVFSAHWFQNNNQFHTEQSFNTFIQRHISTQTMPLPTAFFSLSSSLPLFKNPSLAALKYLSQPQ